MRTRKAIKNAVYSVLYQAVLVICGLITPRLILTTYGSVYNGVTASAGQFLEMISVLTLGIAGSTRLALFKPLADKDTLAISRIIKANKKYMHRVGGAVILYAAVLSIIYPLISHNSLEYLETASLIMIVSVGVFAQYFFTATNQALLSADQSAYLYYIVQIIASIGNTLAAVLLIHLGCSIFTVKLGSALIFLLSPALLNELVKRRYHLTADCEPDNTALKNRGAVAFHSIANLVHEDTDLIVLTLFVDAKLISVYTVYQLLTARIRRTLLMLTNGLEGAFGNLWVRKEYDSFERNFRFFEYLIFAFSSVIFSSTAVMILPFMRLYTHGVTDINYIRTGFAMLTVLTEAVHCIRHPYLVVVQATGNYEATKKAALMEAVINIVLSLTLVQFFGLNGVMFGTLVANLFRTIQYAVFISRNVIIGSLRGTVRQGIWFLANTAIVISLQTVMFRFLPEVKSWGMWVMYGAISATTGFAVTAVMSLLFCREDFQKLLSMRRAR